MTRLTDKQVTELIEEIGTLPAYRLPDVIRGWNSTQENTSLVDWSKAPSWANYHSIDSNNMGFWYAVEPTRGGECWLPTNGTMDEESECDDFWMKTLEKRPDWLVRNSHPHAILMKLYAHVASYRPDPYKEFEGYDADKKVWFPLVCNPAWDVNTNYRHVG